MKDISNFFQDRTVNFDKLLSFGFVKNNEGYIYKCTILNNQFEAIVKITSNKQAFTQLNDIETKEEYVLHLMPDTSGAFVGAIRTEYESLISSINKNCFESNVFKSAPTEKIIKYITERYQDDLEFLWQKFPKNAIFRRKDTCKWYAALLTVNEEKLGLSGNHTIEILNIHLSPDKIKKLIDNKLYFSGYHMNKQHWITVRLDGNMNLPQLYKLIEESYELAKK